MKADTDLSLPVNNMVVDFENVTVTRAERGILSDITWSVRKGSCCAILGPNGSGKSTLIAVLSGYIWPSSGTVTVLGKTYGSVSLCELRQKVGLIEPSRMPGFSSFYTVRQIVATGLFGTVLLPPSKTVSKQQWKNVDCEMGQLGLADHAEDCFEKLSTGEQMKTLIARAIVSDAKLLVLDEPTVGLDIGARAAVVKVLDSLLVRDDSRTLIIVSHHLDELPAKVDQVLFLKAGRILADGPVNTVLTSENLTRAFDCEIQITKNGSRYISCVK